MKKMMVFDIGGNLRYLRKIKTNYVDNLMEKSAYMKIHPDPYIICPKLSKEKLQQMMQVVEEIRLNCNKKYL